MQHPSWRTLFLRIVIHPFFIAAAIIACTAWLIASDFSIVRKAPAQGYWTGGYIAKSDDNKIVTSAVTSFRMNRGKADITFMINRKCEDGRYYQDAIKIKGQRLPAEGKIDFEHDDWLIASDTDTGLPILRFQGQNENNKMKGTLSLGAKYLGDDTPLECQRAIVPIEIIHVGEYNKTADHTEGLYAGVTTKDSPISLYNSKDGHIKQLISTTTTICTLNGQPLTKPAYFVVKVNEDKEVSPGVFEGAFQTKGSVFTKHVKKANAVEKFFNSPSLPASTSIEVKARVRYRLAVKEKAGQLFGKISVQARVLDSPIQGALCTIGTPAKPAAFTLPFVTAPVVNKPGVLCPEKGNRTDYTCKEIVK